MSLQINGVDMTEARHDHAVSLLTAASPTISLLLERETGGTYPPSPPPHSSPTPAATVAATVSTAVPGEPLLPRLSPSLLATALEGPYPVEVRHPPMSFSVPGPSVRSGVVTLGRTKYTAFLFNFRVFSYLFFSYITSQV